MKKIYISLPSHHDYLITNSLSPAAKIDMLSKFLSAGMIHPRQLTYLLNYTNITYNNTLKNKVKTYA